MLTCAFLPQQVIAPQLSQWVPCPPAAPCVPQKCPPRPAPPTPSLWVFSLKQVLSNPVSDCLLSGRRGSGAGNTHCTPMPQHRHFTSLLPLPSIACGEMISRTIKLLQMGSPLLFPGSPTAS